MGILDRLRGKKEDVLPEEVEKYYQSQRRARIGTAWLLGFLALVVTLVVALGLFYGARYVYQQITGPDETTEIAPNGADQPDSAPPETNQTEEKPSSQNQTQSGNGSQDQTPDRNRQNQTAPETGDRLPENGDQQLPAAGDPGL